MIGRGRRTFLWPLLFSEGYGQMIVTFVLFLIGLFSSIVYWILSFVSTDWSALSFTILYFISLSFSFVTGMLTILFSSLNLSKGKPKARPILVVMSFIMGVLGVLVSLSGAFSWF